MHLNHWVRTVFAEEVWPTVMSHKLKSNRPVVTFGFRGGKSLCIFLGPHPLLRIFSRAWWRTSRSCAGAASLSEAAAGGGSGSDAVLADVREVVDVRCCCVSSAEVETKAAPALPVSAASAVL